METVADQPEQKQPRKSWEFRPLVGKGCPTHGKQYALPKSLMCGHAECRKSWLIKCCGHHSGLKRIVRRAQDAGILDDLLQYMAVRYLEELSSVESGGWFPHMSAQWLWYASTRYMKLRAGGRDLGGFVCLPGSDTKRSSGHVSGRSVVTMDEAVLAHALYMDPERVTSGHVDGMAGRTLQEFLLSNGMDLEMLVLRGDITEIDAWKIGVQREKDRIAALPDDATDQDRARTAPDLPTVEARIEWAHSFAKMWLTGEIGGDDGKA